MPDQLEDIIEKNREQLDHREPKADHFARFEEKLNTADETTDSVEEQSKSSGLSFNINNFLKIAAMFVIAFGLAFMLLNNNEQTSNTTKNNTAANDKPTPQQPVALGEVSGEMADVEQYFENTLKVKMEEVNAFQLEDATFVADFMRNLNELEDQYQQLKSELAVNFGDQRIVNAMIQNFRLRVLLMEKLIQQMQHVKQEKKEIS